ncbi:MAG: hypothetical protein ACC657_02725 [Thiohalomonadales bacterium]
MSYQEKNILVSLISTILVFGYYLMELISLGQQDTLNSTAVVDLMVTIIIAMILVNIVTHVVFNIINKMTTEEQEPGFADELDKLIELKATRNSHYAFMIGFMLTILASLVIEISLLVLFILVFLYLISSCIIGEISKLYLYRKGI